MWWPSPQLIPEIEDMFVLTTKLAVSKDVPDVPCVSRPSTRYSARLKAQMLTRLWLISRPCLNRELSDKNCPTYLVDSDKA